MNFIVVQTAFLGDVILTIPLCAALRNAYKNATITFVTTPAGAEVAELIPAITKVVVFDKRGAHGSVSETRKLAQDVGGSEADTVIVPHRSFRTALFVRCLGARNVITYNTAWTRFVSTSRVKYVHRMHDANRQLSLLATLNLPELNVRTSPTCRVEFDAAKLAAILPVQIAHADKTRLAVVAPGSAWKTKQWGAEKFTELCEMLRGSGFAVAIVGSNADSINPTLSGNSLLTDNGPPIIDLCGLTTIGQLVSVIHEAAVLICNDSAPCHIASLTNTPTVAVFGPTSPAFGFSPFAEKSRVIELSGLDCRPCSIHGGDDCPLGTHKCMTEITARQVMTEVNSIFA